MERTASTENPTPHKAPRKKQGGTNRKEHPMKELNRRAFLTLTGAALAMMALTACGADDAPPAPPAPTTPKEAELVAAINKVWKEKHDAGAVAHEQLTLNQDAVGAIRCYGRVFEEANETPHTLKDPDHKIIFGELNGLEEKITEKYGKDSLAGMAGISEPSPDMVVALEDEYSCEDTAVRTFVAKLLNNSNSAKAEFISIYCPVVQGKTYMIAVVFRNTKA